MTLVEGGGVVIITHTRDDVRPVTDVATQLMTILQWQSSAVPVSQVSNNGNVTVDTTSSSSRASLPGCCLAAAAAAISDQCYLMPGKMKSAKSAQTANQCVTVNTCMMANTIESLSTKN